MIFFRILVILSVCITISCTKGPPRPVEVMDDKIIPDFKKEIESLEVDRKKSEAQLKEASERVKDLSYNPKLHDMIRNEIFMHEKYIEQINQQIAYFKIRTNERVDYIQKYREQLSQEKLTEQYDEYVESKKTNPRVYTWRQINFLPIPKPEGKEDKKKSEHGEEKKTEGGHH